MYNSNENMWQVCELLKRGRVSVEKYKLITSIYRKRRDKYKRFFKKTICSRLKKVQKLTNILYKHRIYNCCFEIQAIWLKIVGYFVRVYLLE